MEKQILELIENLSKYSQEMKESGNPKLLFEVCLIKLTTLFKNVENSAKKQYEPVMNTNKTEQTNASPTPLEKSKIEEAALPKRGNT